MPLKNSGVKLEWELVDTSAIENNWRRAPVPGGWLVAGQDMQIATFVPDPKHEWGKVSGSGPSTGGHS